MKRAQSPRNLCAQVVHELGNRILAGDFVPGQPLPQEMTLCDQLGVSRTVIREAIKSLSAKGLVQSRAKLGTLVQPARGWNYLDPEVLQWQLQADTSGLQLFHLIEFRRTIEPTAAALAAERASDEELQKIADACEDMRGNVDDVDAFLVADLRFHTLILHATGNPFFAPVANVISVALESSLRVTNRQPANNRTSVPVHQKVMKAIVTRKPNAAQAAMRALLNDAASRIENASRKNVST